MATPLLRSVSCALLPLWLNSGLVCTWRPLLTPVAADLLAQIVSTVEGLERKGEHGILGSSSRRQVLSHHDSLTLIHEKEGCCWFEYNVLVALFEFREQLFLSLRRSFVVLRHFLAVTVVWSWQCMVVFRWSVAQGTSRFENWSGFWKPETRTCRSS